MADSLLSNLDLVASITGVEEIYVSVPGTPDTDAKATVEQIKAYVAAEIPAGETGAPGAAGDSAYEVAVSNGFEGDEAAWLASLVGDPGAPGEDSTVPGPTGPEGLSAYEVAVDNGFVGDETAWLASLVGPPGEDGEPGGGSSEIDVVEASGLEVSTSNTTSKFDLVSATVASGSITAGDIFRIRVSGDIKNWSAGAVTLTVTCEFGSTVLMTTSAESLSQHTTRYWDFDAEFIVSFPTTSSQSVVGRFNRSSILSSTSMIAPTWLCGSIPGAGSENNSSDKSLKVCAQFSVADSAIVCRVVNAIIEKIPPQ